MMSQRARWVVGGLFTVAFVASSCIATGSGVASDGPGFWLGLWHGAISFVALIVGIFADSVHVYQAPNSGGWYDFGFLMGVTLVWGGGSSGYHHRRRKRQRDKEWEELSEKVQAKIRRKIREWSEADPDDDWGVVEAKATQKFKQGVREWAEEP